MKKLTPRRLFAAVILIVIAVFLALQLYRAAHAGYVRRWEEERNAILPGIVCIGDSLTEGADSSFPPWPAMLEEMFSGRLCSLPVVNLGHGGEDSATIIAQAGGLPLRVHAFTIPAGKEKAAVELYPMDGLEGGGGHLFKLSGQETDALLNPCRIGGVYFCRI